MARRRFWKRDRNGRFAKTGGKGKPTRSALRARRRLKERRRYDRQELAYNREWARIANPARDLSNFDYLSKKQRAREDLIQAKLAIKGRKVK